MDVYFTKSEKKVIDAIEKRLMKKPTIEVRAIFEDFNKKFGQPIDGEVDTDWKEDMVGHMLHGGTAYLDLIEFFPTK